MQFLTARFTLANAELPGDPLMWQTLLDESDVFSYETAKDDKGGPFGAQLWLYNADKDEYVLAGDVLRPQDSNAVVSKGLASAHAEAENLSPEKRQAVIEFLEARPDENWSVVQVSSGESCQSCRSKQVLFSEELTQRGLIEPGDFYVVFKATYDQTKRDANFNDAPYDMAFRAIDTLGLLDQDGGLQNLESVIQEDDTFMLMEQRGDLIYTPVKTAENNNLSDDVIALFEQAGDRPLVILITKDGTEILAHASDERNHSHDGINHIENSAIFKALMAASAKKRQEGIFESWNLEGARLITNIKDIGPAAYAETLWCNLSGIEIARDFTSDTIDILARELPWQTNADTFKAAAANYNEPHASIQTCFVGNTEDANLAHQFWAVVLKKEALLQQQAARLKDLDGKKVSYLDGSPLKLDSLVTSEETSSHYDGKQADPTPVL